MKLLIRAPVAPLLAEPRIASEQLTQVLRGHSCTVLEERGEWLRAAAADDGYEGWLNAGYAMSEGSTPRAMSLGCIVESDEGVMALPFGALLFDSEKISSGEQVSIAQLRALFPPIADSVTATALKYFRGTPYLWGGVTPWGADCSGFVQSVFRTHGVAMKRDSTMQAAAGRESTSDLGNHEPGELLFFSERSDRRVTHVGIGLGAARMVHVALGRGGYSVEDLSERNSADSYVSRLAERFCFARRMF